VHLVHCNQQFSGKKWIVLCAGGSGWINYPFQASIYHAYHMFIDHGIPKENIIVMHYDDLAHNKLNPTPGVIVNQINGSDVYNGVPKDYVKDMVTPEVEFGGNNFLGVLRGDPKLKATGSKVVESGPNDHIFVFFMDHGFVSFPNGKLFSEDLINTLKEMHQNNRYAKLLFYLEACHSASMFGGLPTDINVYAVSSSRAIELSYACCFDDYRKAYVGGFFSNNWYANSEANDFNVETVDEQYKYISERYIVPDQTNIPKNMTEHATHYGDLSIGQLYLSEFFGTKTPPKVFVNNKNDLPDNCDFVNTRDIGIHLLHKNIESTDNISEKLRIHIFWEK
ncbi:unnamed protein product, partial [Oppiella nova]